MPFQVAGSPSRGSNLQTARDRSCVGTEWTSSGSLLQTVESCPGVVSHKLQQVLLPLQTTMRACLIRRRWRCRARAGHAQRSKIVKTTSKKLGFGKNFKRLSIALRRALRPDLCFGLLCAGSAYAARAADSRPSIPQLSVPAVLFVAQTDPSPRACSLSQS